MEPVLGPDTYLGSELDLMQVDSMQEVVVFGGQFWVKMIFA